MSTTFTTPTGRKVTSRTQRAYVLIWETQTGERAWIERRSDSLATLKAHRRKQGFTSAVTWYLGTMSTGEVKPA
jgi:hypothetical protein